MSAKSTTTSIGAYTKPVLRYGFGVLLWTQAELRGIDKNTWKVLTKGKFYHERSDVYKLYFYWRYGWHRLVGVVYNNQKEWKKSRKVYWEVWRTIGSYSAGSRGTKSTFTDVMDTCSEQTLYHWWDQRRATYMIRQHENAWTIILTTGQAGVSWYWDRKKVVALSTPIIWYEVTDLRGTRTGPVYQCDKGRDVEARWFKSVQDVS